MQEAASLQQDLKRAGISPYAWMINQSLSMVPGITDPLLKSRAHAEEEIISNIKENLTERIFGIPYMPVKDLLPELLENVKTNSSLKK